MDDPACRPIADPIRVDDQARVGGAPDATQSDVPIDIPVHCHAGTGDLVFVAAASEAETAAASLRSLTLAGGGGLGGAPCVSMVPPNTGR